MDRAWARPNLTSSDFASTRMSCRDVTGSDVHDGTDVDIDKQYTGVGYHSSAVATLVRLARNIACELRRARDGEWNKMHVMDYVVQSKYLNDCCFGNFLVEIQVGRVVVNGKSQMNQRTVQEVWKMPIAQGKKPALPSGKNTPRSQCDQCTGSLPSSPWHMLSISVEQRQQTQLYVHTINTV